MTVQFENPEAKKLEDETVSSVLPQKKIERVAEKAAEKSTKAVQNYDKDNSKLFSK
ncbi:MAG: hypothetical protein WCA89_09325 [Terracidiphilus sp.]